MVRALPSALRSLAVLALGLAAPAAAQGLVQLRLEGAATRSGGGLAEVELVATSPQGGTLAMELHAHLARGTTAADLAALVVRRLETEGFVVTAPSDPARADGVSVFVEDVLSVHVRLGGGLRGSVTLADRRPAAVRFTPPSAWPEPATIAIAATTLHPHTRQRGSATLELRAEPDTTPVQLAERLVLQAIDEGWVADRPELETWSPVKLGSANEITGCSIELASEGDWGLTIHVERPERR